MNTCPSCNAFITCRNPGNPNMTGCTQCDPTCTIPTDTWPEIVFASNPDPSSVSLPSDTMRSCGGMTIDGTCFNGECPTCYPQCDRTPSAFIDGETGVVISCWTNRDSPLASGTNDGTEILVPPPLTPVANRGTGTLRCRLGDDRCHHIGKWRILVRDGALWWVLVMFPQSVCKTACIVRTDAEKCGQRIGSGPCSVFGCRRCYAPRDCATVDNGVLQLYLYNQAVSSTDTEQHPFVLGDRYPYRGQERQLMVVNGTQSGEPVRFLALA